MHLINGVAFSLVGIFIPIYFLQLGYSLMAVLLYLLGHSLVLLLATFLAGIISKRVGIQKILVLRFPLVLIYLTMLYSLDDVKIPLVILALFSGLQSAFYWTPINILFARFSPIKKLGSTVGNMFAVGKISGIGGPLIGGIVGFFFGFKILFAIAIVLIIIATFPVLKTKLIKADFKFEIKKGWKLYKKYPKYFWADVFDNIAGETEAYFWPLFIFFSLTNVVSVGITGALLALGMAAFNWYMGKKCDKQNKRFFIRLGSVLICVIWLVRYFSDNEIVFYLSSLLSGIALTVLLVPYTAKIFSLAKKETIDEFIIFREIPMAVGRIIIFLIAILFIGNFKILFPIAGLAYLYFLFL